SEEDQTCGGRSARRSLRTCRPGYASRTRHTHTGFAGRTCRTHTSRASGAGRTCGTCEVWTGHRKSPFLRWGSGVVRMQTSPGLPDTPLTLRDGQISLELRCLCLSAGIKSAALVVVELRDLSASDEWLVCGHRGVTACRLRLAGGCERLQVHRCGTRSRQISLLLTLRGLNRLTRGTDFPYEVPEESDHARGVCRCVGRSQHVPSYLPSVNIR